MPVRKPGDCHEPYALLDKNGFPEKYKKVIHRIEHGMTPKDAVMMIFGITRDRWFKWIHFYEEDTGKGYTSRTSNLVKLMEGVARADLKTKYKFERRAMEVALDDENPNTDMIKFVLERRYDYVKKQKSDVEVGAKDDFNFNINITESKPKD